MRIRCEKCRWGRVEIIDSMSKMCVLVFVIFWDISYFLNLCKCK